MMYGSNPDGALRCHVQAMYNKRGTIALSPLTAPELDTFMAAIKLGVYERFLDLRIMRDTLFGL